MPIVWQLIQAIWSGMMIGFQAFFSTIPIYQELSNIRINMITSFLGISAGALGIITLTIKCIKTLYNHVQTK